jgi:hypothetical protein
MKCGVFCGRCGLSAHESLVGFCCCFSHCHLLARSTVYYLLIIEECGRETRNKLEKKHSTSETEPPASAIQHTHAQAHPHFFLALLPLCTSTSVCSVFNHHLYKSPLCCWPTHTLPLLSSLYIAQLSPFAKHCVLARVCVCVCVSSGGP